MKFFIVSLFILSNATAQDINIPEPEWDGGALYVNNGKGVELEWQKAYSKTKADLSVYFTGLGKVRAKRYVRGEGSPVRIMQKDSVQFIVKHIINTTNPHSLIQIFKLTSYARERNIQVETYGALSGGSSGYIKYVKFIAEKYGERSYLITIPKLESGEYAICLSTDPMDFSLFSIGFEKTEEEKARQDVVKGDTVWYMKSKEEWIKATVISKEFAGLKLSYTTQSGKDKVKIIAYGLISTVEKED